MAASEDEEDHLAGVDDEGSLGLILRWSDSWVSASLGRRYRPGSAWAAQDDVPGDEAVRSCGCPGLPVGGRAAAQGMPRGSPSSGFSGAMCCEGGSAGSSRQLLKGEKNEAGGAPVQGQAQEPSSAPFGGSCRLDAAAADVACTTAEAPASPKDETADRHDSRKIITGTICLPVHYRDGDSARDDISALHVFDDRVFVKELKGAGAAFRSGVRAGDELVLIQVGRRRPFSPGGNSECINQLAESSITGMTAALRGPPVVLYFMGFAGKFPAEVRVTVRATEKCGLLRVAELVGLAQFDVADQVVLRPRHAPLLLVSSAAEAESALRGPGGASEESAGSGFGAEGDGDVVPGERGSAMSILELEQTSAKWLLRRACVELSDLGHPGVGGGWLWSRHTDQQEAGEAPEHWALVDFLFGTPQVKPTTAGPFSLCGGPDDAPSKPPPGLAAQPRPAPRSHQEHRPRHGEPDFPGGPGSHGSAGATISGPQVMTPASMTPNAGHDSFFSPPAKRAPGSEPPVIPTSAWRSLPQLPVHTLSLSRSAMPTAEEQEAQGTAEARSPAQRLGAEQGSDSDDSSAYAERQGDAPFDAEGEELDPDSPMAASSPEESPPAERTHLLPQQLTLSAVF